ncbi:MAG: RIP metalloprotease RseP [Lachnospiraceae bacterium]|jgi:regulator of sigma E protease|nr:RIP metalloprotease RseP [Lachnospiraceae bacterium]MEE3461845.1 RIP metalloprotease RseP [Lachnospiraceae bacterium]
MSLLDIFLALLVFTVIVSFHELGHFIFAKRNGVFVNEFSVGMGPRIITCARQDGKNKVRFFCSQKKFEESADWNRVTRYSLKILPLGGSCMMKGEDEEAADSDAFNNKSVWSRFKIVFAGPLFNFILAFVFSIIIIAYNGVDIPNVVQIANSNAIDAGIESGDRIISINGKRIRIGREATVYTSLNPKTDKVNVVYLREGKEKKASYDVNYSTYLFGFNYEATDDSKPVVSGVSDGSAFEKAKIKSGDLIVSIDGEEVKNGADITRIMAEKKESPDSVDFEISRDGQVKNYEVTPVKFTGKTLGFTCGTYSNVNFLKLMGYSLYEVKYWIELTVKSLWLLITGGVSPKDLAGPVGIVTMVGDTVNQSMQYGVIVVIMNLLYMAVLLSANLGVMNLIPFPALDGGRLLFMVIEAVRRKPVNRNIEGYVNLVGFALLMVLMVFVFYNDIMRIIH